MREFVRYDVLNRCYPTLSNSMIALRSSRLTKTEKSDGTRIEIWFFHEPRSSYTFHNKAPSFDIFRIIRTEKINIISNKINTKRYCVKNQLISLFFCVCVRPQRAFRICGTWNNSNGGMKSLMQLDFARGEKNCFRMIDFEGRKKIKELFALAFIAGGGKKRIK